MLQRLLDRIYKKDQKDAPEEQASKTNAAESRPNTEDPAPVNTSALTNYNEQKDQDRQAAQTQDPPPAEATVDDPEELEGKIIDILHTVYDPEIPVDIYELGLIYEVKVDETGMAHVTMTLTAPNCPAAGILPGEVESKARSVKGVRDVKLELTFDPPWDPSRMSEAARLSLGMM